MAFAVLDGFRCYYRIEGRDDRPLVVLSHSLGLDHTMWDPQMPALLTANRVLRYDVRGHGASDAPAGDYTVEQLGTDAVRLLDHLELTDIAWCGASLGGMVGQWLAAHAPDRLRALVLANTSPRIADPAGMEARRRAVLSDGMSAVEAAAMTRFFGRPLLDANPPRVASARATLRATQPAGYAGCCAALRDFDGMAALARIHTRTLIVSGDVDETYAGWPAAAPHAFSSMSIHGPGARAIMCCRNSSGGSSSNRIGRPRVSPMIATCSA